MSLRRQISCLLIAMTIALVAGMYAVQKWVVMPTFVELERQGAVRDVERCREAINRDIESISNVANDWGTWDDSYQYIQDRNEAFKKANLLDESFSNTHLNLICLIDAERNIVWGQMRDAETLAPIEAPDLMASLVAAESPITSHESVDDVAQGILLTSQGPILIAARPITNTARTAPIRGTIVMGRLLDEKELSSLAERMHVKLEVQTLKPDDAAAAMDTPIVEEADSRLLHAYATLRDLHGTPVLKLRIEVPREVTAKGAALGYLSMAYSIAGGLVTLIVLWVVLQWRIAGPLQAMAEHALRLGVGGDLSARLNSQRTDEIGTLAKEFDGMVEHLARSQRLSSLAQRASDAANQSKSEFLANMSHEIRTPMTAILGFADLLLEDGDVTKNPERRVEAARAIQRNGDHLLSIINDILDLSKIESGKMGVELIDYSPQGIVEEVVSLMRVRSQAKGICLDIHYETDLPRTIRTDPTRLRQILVNLVGNAIKFTEVGKVELSVKLAAGEETQTGEPQLQFDVVDTGAGVPFEQRARLFMPFSQADTSTTRKFGGTGLGLSISKRLAELLGGEVRIVESKPGCGSRFRLTTSTGPLDGIELVKPELLVPQVEPATAVAEPAAPLILAGCRLLMAEDGPDNQRLFSFILRKAGAEVTVVENGLLAVEQALQMAQSGQPFDVVLMDMQMPVLDGYEAVARLRSQGYRGPIIALTAHAMKSDRDKCLNVGCDDYASKPIDRNKLIEQIASFCRANRPSPDQQAIGEAK